jgi:uncharacterized protein (TIGR00369 family)
MTDVDTPYEEWVAAKTREHGFLSWLDVGVEAADEGEVVLSVPYRSDLTNDVGDDAGPIHGGVFSTLADTASYYALCSTVPDPDDVEPKTVNLNVSYLRPATGPLRARASVTRRGSTIGVTDVVVQSRPDGGEWVPVATATGTFYL